MMYTTHAFNVLGGVLAGLAVLFLHWLWSLVRNKLTGRQFKQVFGSGVNEKDYALIYAELSLISSDPLPYTKPRDVSGSHFAMSHPVPVSEVRSANYITSAIGKYIGSTPQLRSDLDTEALLDLDFVSFGGPLSNRKTADCQLNQGNQLALFDQANDQFITKSDRQTMVEPEQGFDYGMILKVNPTQFPNRVWLVCAGRGEWGTSGAAWFLANKWKELQKRAHERPFAAVVRVRPGQDQSAEIVSFES